MVAENKMSSLTDEWHLKRENRIKYWIDVHGFNRKMDWRSGREIYSRQFKISESVFRIKIYPNGNNSEDKGNVSVFLYRKRRCPLQGLLTMKGILCSVSRMRSPQSRQR